MSTIEDNLATPMDRAWLDYGENLQGKGKEEKSQSD